MRYSEILRCARMMAAVLLYVFIPLSIMYSKTIVTLVPTAVIGFKSGGGADPALGVWMTHTLTKELGKINALKIPAVETIEKTRARLDIGRDRLWDPTNAARLALELECQQFLVGEMLPVTNSKKMKVRYALYSVSGPEVIAGGELTVNTGIGIYDALDRAKTDLVKKLFEKKSGSRVIFRAKTFDAEVRVNGKSLGIVEKGERLAADYVSNSAIRVEYRHPQNGSVLYVTNLKIGVEDDVDILYQPKARLIIRGLPGALVLSPLEGILAISSNGWITTDVPAITPFKITVRARNRDYEYSLTLPDKTEEVLNVIPRIDPREIDYRNSFPLWNVLLPGFAQYQANDPVLGTVFAVLAAGGIGITALGIYQKSVTDLYLSQSVLSSDIQKYQEYGQFWGQMTAIGAGFWGFTAIASTLYAYFHPSRFIDRNYPEKPLTVTLTPIGWSVAYAF